MKSVDLIKRLKSDLGEAEAKIRFHERKDAIIKMIDYYCDTSPDPVEMQSGILKGLIKEFNRENQIRGCILGLVNEEKSEKEISLAVYHGKMFNRHINNTFATLAMVFALEYLHEKNVSAATMMAHHGELHLMASLIELNDEKLGIVILIGEKSFLDEDLELLKAAEDHIDSAIIQNREFFKMKKLVAELTQEKKIREAMEKIDRDRDRGLPFNEFLNLVAEDIKSIIPAEAAILLYDKKKGAKLAATTLPRSHIKVATKEIILPTANNALSDGKLKNWSDAGSSVKSIICLPLIMGDKKIGVIAAINREDGTRFTRQDEELLEAIGSMMDTALFEGLDRENIKKALIRSVGEEVMGKMLENPSSGLVKPKKRFVTIMESDIRGFTALTEHLKPEQLSEFLNAHLGAMADVIISCGGTIDKFIGDAVLSIFNAPSDQADHALRAIKTAFKMRDTHNQLLKRFAKYGIKNPIGISIASGPLIIGEYGCPLRTDYTGLGSTMNKGCRLNGLAQGNQILIWASTYELVKEFVKVGPPIEGATFKGIDGIHTVYSVIGLLDEAA